MITLDKDGGDKSFAMAPDMILNDVGKSCTIMNTTSTGCAPDIGVSLSMEAGSYVLCWFYLYACSTRPLTFESVRALRFTGCRIREHPLYGNSD